MNTTTSNPSISSAEGFAGWKKLSPDEQTAVKTETAGVLAARLLEGKSKIAIGQHLLNLRVILEPKRMFVAFLKHSFHMSQASGYRYINLYELGESLLPAPVLEAAITRGTPIRKSQIAENPPPKTNDPIAISAYLGSLEELPKRSLVAALESDPEQLMKECVNFVSSRYARLEGTPRQKQKWVSNFVGMLMTKFGLESERTYGPIPVPETFVVKRGRPAEAKAA